MGYNPSTKRKMRSQRISLAHTSHCRPPAPPFPTHPPVHPTSPCIADRLHGGIVLYRACQPVTHRGNLSPRSTIEECISLSQRHARWRRRGMPSVPHRRMLRSAPCRCPLLAALHL